MFKRPYPLFISAVLTFLLSTNFAKPVFAYFVYLKNGQSFDIVEHREERGLLILKFRAGYEVGFPKEEFDIERTEASYQKYNELVNNEIMQARRRKELEEKEKAKKDDFVTTFLYEKRGMQLLFSEEDVMQLVEFGEKNLDRFEEVISAYTFFNDYLPSVVYTKRLRMILYGMDKGRGKRTFTTTDVQNIILDPNLLILVGLTGNEPDELEGAEIYIEQEGKKVLPYNFKVPSKGERTVYWPKTPSYFWRILVNFPYENLNFNKNAKLIVKKNNFYREFTLNFPSYR